MLNFQSLNLQTSFQKRFFSYRYREGTEHLCVVHNKDFITCYCAGESQFFREQEGEVGYLLMNFSSKYI